MKQLYTLPLIYFISALFSFAQAQTSYGKVLYRVNNGGAVLPSHDTSSVGWSPDDFANPSLYIDTVGSKTFGVFDNIILDGTIPAGTPEYLLQTERALWRWDLPAVSYNFPVPAGQKVEVRLYFSELYFTNPGDRVMDVMIDGIVVLNDLDVVATTGGIFKGTMRFFIVTSDGNLDIDIARVVQQPKVNAIEIIEIKNTVIQGLFDKTVATSLPAYPNPFKDAVSIDLTQITASSVEVFDSYGAKVSGAVSEITGNNLSINLSTCPAGIYFARIMDENSQPQTVRLIKE